jgi:hypothetical protein
MFSTDTNIDEWYEQRRVNFESLKETLVKEPTDKGAKKEYSILCHTKKDWEHVHEILMQDGTLEDNIPSRSVDCPSACNHSDLRGIYLLDDEEVEQLRNHPGVANVTINAASYPGTYMDNPDDLVESLTKENRYASNVWCQGYSNTNGYLSSTPGIDLKNRGSMQLLRHVQKASPWVSGQWEARPGLASTTAAYTQIGNQIPQYGTGKDVDVIVCDQDMWFGHIEFQNTLGISTLTTSDTPQNYVGGNKLSNSGISTTVGTCDLLDLVLDAPYYLDPDFFNAGLDPEYWNGKILNLIGDGSDLFKREVTVNGVRIVSAGTTGGQTAVPDAFLEKVARMFELFTDSTGVGINTTFQRTFIKTLSGDTGTFHEGLPTIQRVARGAGADYTPNFLTDAGAISWNLTNLYDTHVQNDMVWYLNSTGDPAGDGDQDAQEVIEHVFHTLHMHGLPADDLKLYPQINTDWNTGPLYNAMVEAYDGGYWDPSGYEPSPGAFKTNGDAFEVAAKEYLYLLNFCMFEYTSLWEGGSLSPEWSDNMRTQVGIQSNNPLGYSLHNTYISPVISKPSLTTIRNIFQDGDTGDPTVAGSSGYVVDDNGRTEARWDGTTVPTDSAGLNWWRNNSTTYRSPKFVSIGIGDGEAVAGSVEDFGAILVNASYTRSVSNGSNTAYQNNSGFHGTPCASQAYGRQYGWAYNSNKWFLNLYGTYGVLWEVGFDMQKISHQIKPINPAKGDKDPTISSNSWSNRRGPHTMGYINHRDAAGTGQAPLDGSNAVFYGSQVGPLIGSGGTLAIEYEFDNSIIQSGVELVDSGVIFCYAAGNRDQKVVRGDHPDYNNYYTLSDNQTPEEGRRSGYSSMPGIYYQPFYNRIGYPGQIGKRHDSKGVAYYKGIGVGALDELGYIGNAQGEVGFTTFYRQCKTDYSNMGNGVDVFALCDLSMSACEDNSSGYKRYDDFYVLDGVTSVESEDRQFNGTSSATPIAVGLMATKLEYNRDWTWADMKHWFKTALGGPLAGSTDSAGTSTVYAGVEGGADYTSSLWTDAYNLQGSDAPVIWDAPTGAEPNLTKLIDGGAQDLIFSGDITIKIVE